MSNKDWAGMTERLYQRLKGGIATFSVEPLPLSVVRGALVRVQADMNDASQIDFLRAEVGSIQGILKLLKPEHALERRTMERREKEVKEELFALMTKEAIDAGGTTASPENLANLEARKKQLAETQAREGLKDSAHYDKDSPHTWTSDVRRCEVDTNDGMNEHTHGFECSVCGNTREAYSDAGLYHYFEYFSPSGESWSAVNKAPAPPCVKPKQEVCGKPCGSFDSYTCGAPVSHSGACQVAVGPMERALEGQCPDCNNGRGYEYCTNPFHHPAGH